ncbi:carbohydrate ABC transporter permease [Paenibacillus alkalitolerans]|uniref:carbohydrate ABC transporter permease n=1 Tax=Paenibacillus alkalitolerans TaxID=2799335 RepID=UPI0018F47DC7|nr:carbohydrate ABC transporter permease [Paenibacillus alkalitolerans]
MPRIKSIPAYAVILFFFCVTILPLLWVIVGSLKTNAELMRSPFSLPAVWRFSNYIKAFQSANLGQLFINTITISTVSVACTLLFSSMAAYAVHLGGKIGKIIYAVIITGIFLPINSLMVPYFLIASNLNILNTKMSLITTYSAVGMPLTLLIVYGFVSTLPKELFESAQIDGSGFYHTFWRILLPLIRPGLATAGIFQFLFCWNEFLYALLLTSDQSVRTLQVGISLFKAQFSADFSAMFAAIIMSIIPIVTIFILLQRQVIEGLTNGAIKG